MVSYEELLALFWKSHDPTARPYARQYASLVLASDDEQLAAARASAQRYERDTGDKVLTQIEKRGRFYPAEDYHQKYYLRQDRALAQEFRAMYGEDQEAFRDSTAAARVNGYVAGYGTKAQLEGEADALGLGEKARSELLSRVSDGASAAGCVIESP